TGRGRLAQDSRRLRGRQAAADQGPRRAAPQGLRQGRRARPRAHRGTEAREQEGTRAPRGAAEGGRLMDDELLKQGPREAPEPETAEERSSRTGLKTAGGGVAAGGIGLAKAGSLGDRKSVVEGKGGGRRGRVEVQPED